MVTFRTATVSAATRPLIFLFFVRYKVGRQLRSLCKMDVFVETSYLELRACDASTARTTGFIRPDEGMYRSAISPE